MKIRPVQIQLIHIAKADLGLSDDLYRDMLHGMFQVDSSKDLSAGQADQLIDEFKAKGFQVKPRHPRPARRPKGKNVVNLASQAEIDKLSAVAGLIQWRAENGLALFLEKRVGIKGGRVRTAGEAYRAIEALKKMFENSMAKAYGAEWWTILFDDPGIERYIDEHAPAQYRDSKGRVFKRGA